LYMWHVSARSRRLYLASSLRSSQRGPSAHCVSRPRYTRHFSGLFSSRRLRSLPSRLKARLGVQIAIASGLFVLAAASTRVLAFSKVALCLINTMRNDGRRRRGVFVSMDQELLLLPFNLLILAPWGPCQ